ncbi:hypothetical protein PC128_g19982 [Phytophthora cactorum]|nr:hypothetical protein PC120_g19553 [Phytophthora cactorum]KAG3165163.1 hypothetical protein PC128_g19982 [Phytophthora cactorum]
MPCDWRPQAPSIDRACAEAQVGEDLPGPPSRYLPNDGIDRVDYDESLLPENSRSVSQTTKNSKWSGSPMYVRADVLGTAVPCACTSSTGRATVSHRRSTKLVSAVKRCCSASTEADWSQPFRNGAVTRGVSGGASAVGWPPWVEGANLSIGSGLNGDTTQRQGDGAVPREGPA